MSYNTKLIVASLGLLLFSCGIKNNKDNLKDRKEVVVGKHNFEDDVIGNWLYSTREIGGHIYSLFLKENGILETMIFRDFPKGDRGTETLLVLHYKAKTTDMFYELLVGAESGPIEAFSYAVEIFDVIEDSREEKLEFPITIGQKAVCGTNVYDNKKQLVFGCNYDLSKGRITFNKQNDGL